METSSSLKLWRSINYLRLSPASWIEGRQTTTVILGMRIMPTRAGELAPTPNDVLGHARHARVDWSVAVPLVEDFVDIVDLVGCSDENMLSLYLGEALEALPLLRWLAMPIRITTQSN